MDSLSDMLGPDNIALALEEQSFEDVLEGLANRMGKLLDLSGTQCRALHQSLMEREEVASTAIGHGVAVPHAYLEGLPRTMLLLGVCGQAVECPTPDGEGVDLVVLLAGPPKAERGHLPLLAHIVRMLHDAALRAALRRAATPEAALEAIGEAEARHG